MKQILIATHGKMASGIRYTAEMIAGKSEEITTIDAYVNAEEDVEKQFEEYFEAHKEDRVFVFTDLMGGSVNQKIMKYASETNVTLITGTNLPVLIQVMLAEEDVSTEEVLEYIEDSRKELQVIGTVKPEAEEAPEVTESLKLENTESQKPAEPAGHEMAEADFQNSTAKISALRIDDRLIHGQVAMTWTKQLRVQGIIVANDDAANDNTQKMALKMAVPSGIKVLIKPVEEAIRMLNYPKASQMRILVLTRTVRDALRIRQNVGEIEFLNLGNTGRFDGIDISEKRVITPTVMLTEAEMECLKELTAIDPKLCMQQVPNDEQKLVTEVLEKLK